MKKKQGIIVKYAKLRKKQALIGKKREEDSALLAAVAQLAELMVKQARVLEFLADEIYSADVDFRHVDRNDN